MVAHRFFRQLSFLLSSDGGNYMSVPQAQYAAWVKEVRENFPVEVSTSMERSMFNKNILENTWNYGLAWSAKAWEKVGQDLRTIADNSRANGFALRFVVFPIEMQVQSIELRDFPQQQLARIAEELEVPMLDLLPSFRERHAEDSSSKLFFDGMHLSELGHQVSAELIWEFLQAHPPERIRT